MQPPARQPPAAGDTERSDHEPAAPLALFASLTNQPAVSDCDESPRKIPVLSGPRRQSGRRRLSDRRTSSRETPRLRHPHHSHPSCREASYVTCAAAVESVERANGPQTTLGRFRRLFLHRLQGLRAGICEVRSQREPRQFHRRWQANAAATGDLAIRFNRLRWLLVHRRIRRQESARRRQEARRRRHRGGGLSALHYAADTPPPQPAGGRLPACPRHVTRAVLAVGRQPRRGVETDHRLESRESRSSLGRVSRPHTFPYPLSPAPSPPGHIHFNISRGDTVVVGH